MTVLLVIYQEWRPRYWSNNESFLASQKRIYVVNSGEMTQGDSIWVIVNQIKRLNTRLQTAKDRLRQIPATRLDILFGIYHDSGSRILFPN